mmetsp:Transcript_47737/g.121800  ORF Transcript_47737/g.121800 Transcript_47737/m.121800 type:complete len:233 (+) Transcript_47737:374-1072(+)
MDPMSPPPPLKPSMPLPGRPKAEPKPPWLSWFMAVCICMMACRLAGSIMRCTISGLDSMSRTAGLASAMLRSWGLLLISESIMPGLDIICCIIDCIAGFCIIDAIASISSGLPPMPGRPPPSPPSPGRLPKGLAPGAPAGAAPPPPAPPPPPPPALQGLGSGAALGAAPPLLGAAALAPPVGAVEKSEAKGLAPAPAAAPVPGVFSAAVVVAFIRGSCTFSYIRRSMLKPSG